MDIDIGFWLTLLVLIGTVIWLADWRLKLRREDRPSAVRETVEFSNSMLPVFVVVLVVRSFLFEPFTIPTPSMLPTLQVHDFILVNKFAYGVRLPVTHTRILETGSPRHGDVMVFRYPEDTSKNYIKRVIGLPGDHVAVRDGELFLNEQPVARELKARAGSSVRQEAVFVETLNDHRYTMRHEWVMNPYTGQMMRRPTDGEWRVPQDSYFVIGDNRDNSLDSRSWGFVPESHVAGKAVLIWMHWKSLFSLPSFSRNGAIDREEAAQ